MVPAIIAAGTVNSTSGVSRAVAKASLKRLRNARLARPWGLMTFVTSVLEQEFSWADNVVRRVMVEGRHWRIAICATPQAVVEDIAHVQRE